MRPTSVRLKGLLPRFQDWRFRIGFLVLLVGLVAVAGASAASNAPESPTDEALRELTSQLADPSELKDIEVRPDSLEQKIELEVGDHSLRVSIGQNALAEQRVVFTTLSVDEASGEWYVQEVADYPSPTRGQPVVHVFQLGKHGRFVGYWGADSATTMELELGPDGKTEVVIGEKGSWGIERLSS